jgi:hypothetical protein
MFFMKRLNLPFGDFRSTSSTSLTLTFRTRNS